MSTIYIDEQGAVLHHRGEEVEVEKDHIVLAKLPLAQIDRVVLAGAVQLSTQVMELFLKHNIPVSFMTVYGNYRGRLTPPTHKNVGLRLAQYRNYLDDDFRLRQGDDAGYYLVDKGRKGFYRSYENKIRTEVTCNGQCMTYRRVFFTQAEALARVIRGEESVYKPYLMR